MLGVYTIQRKLGEGGMGAVYLAIDTRLKREAAIKVMRPEIASHPLARARFLREAQAMAAVKHENVATIHAANEEADGTTWLAMELLEGESLDDAVKRGKWFDWKTIFRLGREVALGLQAAHAKRLIHRDIKPANIWLEAPDGKVKLLDFGLARQVETEGHLTGSGAMLGTPSYMSPEQANGDPLDGRCDLFSLGVLLYRLVTGKLPFTGPTVMATVAALASKDPTPVLTLRPDCPTGLAALIHLLLAKNRNQRPATAKAVADELLKIERDGSQTQVVVPPVPEDKPKPGQEIPEPRTDPAAEIDDSLKSFPVEKPTTFPPVLEETSQPDEEFVVTESAPEDGAVDLPKQRRRKRWLISAAITMLLMIIGFLITQATDDQIIAMLGRRKHDKPIETRPLPQQIIPISDRETAEYLKSVGGTWYYPFTASNVSRTDEPVTMFYTKNTHIDFSRFKDHANIVYLTLACSSVTDDDLANFKNCKNLKTLHLQSFTGSCSQVTDAGLAHFNGCDQLNELHLEETQAGAAGLEFLLNHSNLSTLSLSRTKITDKGLLRLQNLKKLRRLDISWTKVGDSGLATIQNLPSLESINMSYTQITDIGLACLGNFQNLQTISLDGMKISNAGLASLKNCPKLSAFYLSSMKINDEGLAHLVNCKLLSDLYLGYSDINDAGLSRIKEIRNLKTLNLRFTKVTAAGVADLGKALPKCKIEWDGGIREPTEK
ncbi:protein kinase domain-containing protein [Zavarzinella formosa]|uniref:protein kinase domain-containing protein n=1 Tax=Zavarzinella formosa TaxID=360055 RepID=UPI0021BBC676|nr:protein kinase [Zavarzinella formosa]